MTPTFWKLSLGKDYFFLSDVLQCINKGLVALHQKSPGMTGRKTSQAQDFAQAADGDYFYLTHGNEGIYMLGQFTGPVNLFHLSKKEWIERPFRAIAFSDGEYYDGEAKWWTPNFNSTFIKVPEEEHKLFEEFILKPYFHLKLKDFKI